MQKIFREEVVRVITEMKFSWKDPCSDWSAELTVDKDGNPIGASYGSMKGWRSRSREDTGFDSTVYEVMKTFLEHDKEEFIQMRDSVRPKYKQMAEDVRRMAIRKYDF